MVSFTHTNVNISLYPLQIAHLSLQLTSSPSKADTNAEVLFNGTQAEDLKLANATSGRIKEETPAEFFQPAKVEPEPTPLLSNLDLEPMPHEPQKENVCPEPPDKTEERVELSAKFDERRKGGYETCVKSAKVSIGIENLNDRDICCDVYLFLCSELTLTNKMLPPLLPSPNLLTAPFCHPNR